MFVGNKFLLIVKLKHDSSFIIQVSFIVKNSFTVRVTKTSNTAAQNKLCNVINTSNPSQLHVGLNTDCVLF